ncbi:MAG: hypothetical protein ABI867_25975 [Kofleriaceae bacterium]
MAVRDDLEATLLAGWNADDLAVYGDQLLAVGDPRGELVQLDLSPQPNLRIWWTRRRAALESWLGSELATRAGHLVQHGFVPELRDGWYPEELLAHKLGAYVRGFTTWGRERVPRSLARLAAQPRPWLRRLAIAYWGSERISDRLRADLIAATPRLEELVLIGTAAFDSFPHPALRRAIVDRRYFTVFPSTVQLIKRRVPEGASDLPLSDDDLDLVLDVVDGTGDCNLVYTIDLDAVAPVVTRLAAAGLVGLVGPVARLISTARRPSPYAGFGAPAVAALRGTSLNITGDRGRKLTIFDAQDHRLQLLAAIDRYPLPTEYRDVLERYLRALASSWETVFDEDRTRQLATALAAVVEQRALWPDALDVTDERPWLQLEPYLELLVSARNGVTVAAAWANNDYDW